MPSSRRLWKRGFRLPPPLNESRCVRVFCLLAAEGKSNNSIAVQLGVTRPTILLWRNRFARQGPIGLAEDAPHGRSSRRTKDKLIQAIVEATLHTTPADATQWSTRTMASKFG